MHGGYQLWLYGVIAITLPLIHKIIRFPMKGEDPEHLFKDNSKTMGVKLFIKYSTTRGE